MRDSQTLTQLIQIAMGYSRAQVLFTAHRCGVFDFLARNGARTATEVADHCKTAPRQTAHLLNACAPLGLLKKDGEHYQNTPLAAAYLVPSSSSYMGEWLNLWAIWYRRWADLEQTVRSGRPIQESADHLGGDADYTRNFIMAMHQYARGPGKEIVRHVDLSGRRRLLDVGGGPGTYSLLLAQQNPQLSAVVFDLPDVVNIAREVIAGYAMSDRVTVRAASYLSDAFGHGDFDVVLLSNMLNQEDDETCKAILRKAHDALEPGGLLIIQAMFLNATKDGPLFPVLQSLLLNLLYEGGRAYSVEETLALVAATGFVDARPKRMSLLNAESLVLAKKA
jgi:predicted O-methyltransferase YrrM